VLHRVSNAAAGGVGAAYLVCASWQGSSAVASCMCQVPQRLTYMQLGCPTPLPPPCGPGSASAVPVTSDQQAATEAAKLARQGTYGLVWVQLRELQNFYWDRCGHAKALYPCKCNTLLHHLQERIQRDILY
jgi:hypothetical protein